MADHGLAIPDARRIVREYRSELIRQLFSATTVKVYDRGARLLLDFARPRDVLNRETIRRWQDFLRSKMSARSAALYGVSVRKMLLWAADNGECDAALARAIPPSKYQRQALPRPLKPDDVRKIEDFIRERAADAPSVHALRDRALFYYARATAARTGELVQVRRADFDRAPVRQTQRGGDDKVLAPPPGVTRVVREYLDARTDGLDCLWVAVLPSGKVRPLADDGINKVWERLARGAGVAKFTTRQLRHTAGAMLAARGRDLTDIMLHLGARDVRAVQGYRVLVSLSRAEEVRADLDVTP